MPPGPAVDHVRTRTYLAAALLLLSLAYFVSLETSLAGPALDTNYYALCIDAASDCFVNWDSSSDSTFDPSTADWPVTLIYYGDAEVDKIKLSYGWTLTGFGASMYMLMTDNGITWFVDSDRGMKEAFVFLSPLNICNYTIDAAYVHVRLYANSSTDYNYYPSLGRYVVATSHLDDWPLEDWSGFASTAESVAVAWASQQLGWTVYPDYVNGYNGDDCRVVGDHINNNDGMISYIYVPPS